MFKNFKEEYIKGEGATLYVRRAGPEGAPPIVLLHGYPQTSAMWHGVAPILARSFQVICPDLRGYGKSDKPVSDSSHSIYSKRAMAKDIVAIMKHLGHKKYHFYGNYKQKGCYYYDRGKYEKHVFFGTGEGKCEDTGSH